MTDIRSLRRPSSSRLEPIDIDRLQPAAAHRVGGRPSAAGHALTRVIEHADALETAEPTVSPAKARGGSLKTSPPDTFGLTD